MDDFYENLTALTDNLSDIVFSRYAEVTKVDGYSCECKENESGVLHIDVPLVNNLEVEVGDFVVLGFVDNDLYSPIILGMLEPRGGGGELPIVTEWEQVLSDEKVPSEKLTKDTIDTKVDKETGKGLSTNDYTTEEKEKLAGIEDGANKTTVDTALSTSSTNPVQNKVVKGALDLKADTSSLSTVATTGDYDDLVDKPNLATVATTGDYDDLTDKPNLATVATTGDYTDLTNKPVVDSTLSNTSTNALQNKTIYTWLTVKADKSSLSTVATSGNYNDLSNKPNLSTVATTGSYSDLSNKPIIPSKTSDLINDGDGTNPFLTQHQSLSGYLKTTDVVDDLTSTDTDKPLSAKQGKTLNDTKVDKITGKGLSTEDYTTSEKTKLAGIEDGANKITVDDDLSSTSMNPLTNRRTYRWLTMKADKSSLSTVATSGSYNDLTDKPSIPPGVIVDQTLDSSSINAVANQAVVGGLNNKADTSSLATVATSGSYNDLSDKPSIYDIDKVYPVGSIYMSVNNTNPSTLFGGTWEQLQDRFLLGAGSKYSAGSSGGSEDTVVVSHSHTTGNNGYSFLNTDGNVGTFSSGKNLNGLSSGSQYPVYATTHANIGESSSTASEGESGTGKNMPPFLVVYMWKRIS